MTDDIRAKIDRFCNAAGSAPDKKDLHKLIAGFCEDLGYVSQVTPEAVLRRADLKVHEVIDVGVHRGTPFLYDAFPECYFLLVDPQKRGEELLERPPAKFKFVNTALGSHTGQMVLNESASRSSFKEWVRGAEITGRYSVPVTTLDDLIAKELSSDRIGIKIDAEGFEGEVVKGLNKAVDRVQFVIAEVSIRKRMHDAPDFAEFAGLMRERGFAFYNLMDSLKANPSRYCDVLFLRSDDPRFAL